MSVECDLVVVVAFGTHDAELIARRVREAGLQFEIVPPTFSMADILTREPKAIILSGGPQSVYSPDAPELDPHIFDSDIPIFGICFGFQAMTVALGGAVRRSGGWEFGPADVKVAQPGTLLTAIPTEHRVWMSHADSVEVAPPGMRVLASTSGSSIAAFESTERRIAGVQWHPEDLHTEHGRQVLERFLVDIAGCQPTWSSVGIEDLQLAPTADPGTRAKVLGKRSNVSNTSSDEGEAVRRKRRIPTGRRLWLVTVIALVMVTGGSVWALSNRVDRGWDDGQRYGDWLAVFNGYGRTTSSFDNGIETVILEPQDPVSDAVTHASLVVSVAQYGDAEVNATVKTDIQLRSHPNPWEVAWLLVRYSDPDHFYSLTLKPNGWELSKQDPAYPGKQRFLATGTAPVFPVGYWHQLRVSTRGATIEAYADGVLLTRFTDDERPYLRGSIGLYTEDAHALFQNVIAST